MEVKKKTIFKIVYFIVVLYIFLVSIQLLGASFKMFGTGFAEQLIKTTSNPLVGLFIGIAATSLIQSSSTTTSIVVGLVAGDALTLPIAIPIVMGANIGTTVTNTLVSMAHVSRKHEFEKAFAAATVHDFFNVLAVVVLFPLEMLFHPIEKVAIWLGTIFTCPSCIAVASPLKLITNPIVHIISEGISHPIILTILSLFLLFFSLIYMVKIMKVAVIPKIGKFFDTFLFKDDYSAFIFGTILTAIVQSSSVTTSVVIPLVGAGLLTVRKVFPYMLGSNIGTTITSMLAAFATLNVVAITVAFSHLVFNIFGILIFYPLKNIPIKLAEWFAKITAVSKKRSIAFFACYYLAYIIPLTILLVRQ
ncbi:Na/Pi cotransporter family protein [Candidatus Woesearchaeota archaeon]|nr:Na/Pi cotransporter family protein [Candidatus Woesearchaeota archaeon]